MFDFTLSTYRSLLTALQSAGFSFLTMEEFATCNDPIGVVCLRHDIDLKPKNALRFAQLEHQLGIKATYYFRVVPQSNQPDIIRAIAQLGHEIGYHYEDMAIANGDIHLAYDHFCQSLSYFRSFYPVRTICMHGAPTSLYDGRDLWKTYDYKALGITCEPYLDIDYSKVFYLTDTGRCWDGYHVSVRDKIPIYQDQWTREKLVFHSTQDILRALADKGKDFAPYRILITTHPQRWNNNPLSWLYELLFQSLKNIIKRALIRLRQNKS